ncbi:plasmid partitioning protein RepB C-terminal domain-containing protein [Pantoea sp. EA-12]|uniref:plasmid partitioning protein RepB C-terminal domain-containing protein n=1 Tax=Pantoea sp. EA-12 TaxID=3043303 RepID=UPI0024B598A3|nr:plasmid partitioning protein RepB C-terminal domain-containing protein [Pantoea sp. EA-12]MDI9222121.1 plasmid partitioning protein RepB C-terminal domain-containing protein [Pantoea sp. EA-12]
MIQRCFNDEFLELPVSRLISSRKLPENIKLSVKYRQIVASIKEIGLVEPVIIFPEDGGRILKIIDGHLRVEALIELSIDKVTCLVSTIPDSYTPNKQVNRLTVLQEHKMIKKAIDSGVTVSKLGAALGLSAEAIRQRFNLTKGVEPEVMNLLANNVVPLSVFSVLRKMKPLRQIEVAHIMVNLQNFSLKFAESLLYATEERLLLTPGKKKETMELNESIVKLEREMNAVQQEVSNIDSSYSEEVLKFVIIKNHITSLLNNPKVVLWLLENNDDYLKILKRISDVKNLDSAP